MQLNIHNLIQHVRSSFLQCAWRRGRLRLRRPPYGLPQETPGGNHELGAPTPGAACAVNISAIVPALGA